MKETTLRLLGIFILLLNGTIASDAQSQHQQSGIDCTLCHVSLDASKEDPKLKPCPRHAGSVVRLENMGPDIVILDELQELEDLYVPVRFNHKTHAHMSSTVEGCNMCHHYNEASATPSSCAACHPKDVIHENLAQPGLKGAYHRQCIGCHVQWDQNTDCVICHEKKAGGPLHGSAVSYSNVRHYPPVQMRDLIVYQTGYDTDDTVPFHHKTHAYQYDRNCGDCHHQQGCDACHAQQRVELKPMGDLSPEEMHDHCFVCHGDNDCNFCHGRAVDDVFDHAITGWPLKVYHQKLHCMDCHTQRGEFTKLNNDCVTCHLKGWNLDEFKHTVVGVPLDDVHENAACEDCHGGDIETVQNTIVLKSAEIESTCTNCHDDNRAYDAMRGFTE